MAMPDPPEILVDAIVPYLDERVGRAEYLQRVVNYRLGEEFPNGRYVGRPMIEATPFRLTANPTDREARVALARFAVHMSTRSERQRNMILIGVRNVLREGRTLICPNCPRGLCHAQVHVAWVNLRFNDPFADLIGPQSRAYRRMMDER